MGSSPAAGQTWNLYDGSELATGRNRKDEIDKFESGTKPVVLVITFLDFERQTQGTYESGNPLKREFLARPLPAGSEGLKSVCSKDLNDMAHSE